MNQALRTFVRERGRYRDDQRRYHESRGRQWRADDTEWLLNEVEREIADKPVLAADYLTHYNLGRDYGADAKWVGEQMRLARNRVRWSEKYHKGVWRDPKTVRGTDPWRPADGVVEDDTGDGSGFQSSELDQAAHQSWKNGGGIGIHPLSRKDRPAEGFRDWTKLQAAFESYLLDVGGAAIQPGVQVPKEIVRDFVDKIGAHIDYLEPLAKGMTEDAMTQAYLFVTMKPAVLKGDVEKLLESKYKHGRRVTLTKKYLQFCGNDGLPFVAFTDQGNPTSRPKYCDDQCKRERDNRARRKRV